MIPNGGTWSPEVLFKVTGAPRDFEDRAMIESRLKKILQLARVLKKSEMIPSCVHKKIKTDEIVFEPLLQRVHLVFEKFHISIYVDKTKLNVLLTPMR